MSCSILLNTCLFASNITILIFDFLNKIPEFNPYKNPLEVILFGFICHLVIAGRCQQKGLMMETKKVGALSDRLKRAALNISQCSLVFNQNHCGAVKTSQVGLTPTSGTSFPQKNIIFCRFPR